MLNPAGFQVRVLAALTPISLSGRSFLSPCFWRRCCLWSDRSKRAHKQFRFQEMANAERSSTAIIVTQLAS